MTRAVLAGMLDIEYRYSATANDGRITSRRDNLSGEEVTYQYDVLGRLERAETVGTEWGLAWSFDGFGNRTQQSVVKGSGPVMSVAVNGLTNRVIGDSYDLNGNLTATAGGATYTWDAANRLTQFQSAQVTESYAYDPQNRRVWRRDGAGNEFVGLYGIDEIGRAHV